MSEGDQLPVSRRAFGVFGRREVIFFAPYSQGFHVGAGPCCSGAGWRKRKWMKTTSMNECPCSTPILPRFCPGNQTGRKPASILTSGFCAPVPRWFFGNATAERIPEALSGSPLGPLQNLADLAPVQVVRPPLQQLFTVLHVG